MVMKKGTCTHEYGCLWSNDKIKLQIENSGELMQLLLLEAE